MERFIQIAIYFTLFLVPITLPFSDFGYEQAKVVLFIFLVTLTAFIWLFYLRKANTKFKWSQIRLAATVFIVILLVTAFLGINPFLSFFGNYPYYQGWVLYFYLFLFYLIVSTIKLKLSYLTTALFFSCLIVSILAIKDFVLVNLFYQDLPTYAGRVVSTFGQPNLYSGYLLLGLPLFFYLLNKTMNKEYRILILMGIVINITAIFLSFSRAAIGILVIFLVFWGLFNLSKKIQLVLTGLIIVILFSTLSLSIYLQTGVIWNEIIIPFDNQWLINNSPEKRIFIYPVILDLIYKNPLGYGLENLSSAFSSFERLHGARSPAYYGIKNLLIDRSHNYPLDLLVFSGIFGLIAWGYLIYKMLKKVRKKVILVSLLIYLLWVQVQIQSMAHLMFFWLLVGLIDSEEN